MLFLVFCLQICTFVRCNVTVMVDKLKRLTPFTLLMVAILCFTAASQKQTTIFIVGDSTAANKDTTNGKQERGWGMMLQRCFDAHIRIDNHAVNGRSSLTFLNEGRWQKVLDLIQPGDYVIIQFGHNDEKNKPDRHTEPGSTFDDNLERYVRETRQRGGIPVLMNPVVRRNFQMSAPQIKDDEELRTTTAYDGAEMTEGDTLIDTHGLYRVAPRNVARRTNCHFVDANQITHNLEQSLGKEGSKRLHMWFLPGEHPSLPKGRRDNTHYNVYGATVVARLLADALCREIPQLRKHRVKDQSGETDTKVKHKEIDYN